MNREDFEQLRGLYHELADLPPADRRARLSALEVSGPVREELIELLGHEDGMELFEERRLGAYGALAAAVAAGDEDPDRPSEIAGFHITGVLGRGGMGIVYRGVQDQPRRDVAIKVLQGLAANAEARRRFEYEAEALARLDHPYVAKVFEAGVDAHLGDLPYIVMELVEGRNLLEHCHAAALSVDERLTLLASVCEGVEHAHQHGIVHRDLKPANILVSPDGRPRILDFGIARPVSPETLQDASTPGRTESGSVLGSPAWMSPEQARGEVARIDVRTDVYSLGVILYRVLAGRMPYDVDDVTPWAAARRICEVEPQRLGRELRGDVEAIVTMALDKEPSRRYPGAGALGRDIRRFLAVQPVEARPWSGTYQLAKFARRHRLLVASAAALLVSLAGGFGTSLALWRDAEAARALADREARNARASEAVAKEEALTTENVLGFLIGMFDEQAAFEVPADELTVREVLDRASARIHVDLAHEPVVLARLSQAMGDLYQALGLHERAAELMQAALEIRRRELAPNDVAVLESLRELAAVERQRGRLPRAEALLEECLPLLLAQLDSAPELAIGALHESGLLQLDQGHFEEAEGVLLRALELAREHLAPGGPESLGIQAALAAALLYSGDLEGGEAYAQAAYEGQARRRTSKHPYALNAANTLAEFRKRRGDVEGAIELARQVMEGLHFSLKADHPHTLLAMHHLGDLFVRRGDLAQAEPLLEATHRAQREVLGERHATTLATQVSLADVRRGQGRFDEAEGLLLDALEGLEASLGPTHERVTHALSKLAMLAFARGDFEAVEEWCVEQLERGRQGRGLSSSGQRSTVANYSGLLVQQGRFGEARELWTETIRDARDKFGEDTQTVLELCERRAAVWVDAGEVDVALEELESVLERARIHLGADHALSQRVTGTLAQLRQRVDRSQ